MAVHCHIFFCYFVGSPTKRIDIQTRKELFYKLLWNPGPDRTKRKIIIKIKAFAGLRMVELRSFIKAQYVSWLRRILHQTKPNEWTCL